MVRAIREGRKTQTRMVIKPHPLPYVMSGKHGFISKEWSKDSKPWMEIGGIHQEKWICPYGQPGDRLWVRETFRLFNSSVECACYDECWCASNNGKPVYRADCDSEDKWKPSIYMPRWASRITLEIVSVRVERLHDISEDDAKAEGANFGFWHPEKGVFAEPTDEEDEQNSCFRDGYGFLWESINGVGSWDLNQWVWVIEFKEVKP